LKRAPTSFKEAEKSNLYPLGEGGNIPQQKMKKLMPVNSLIFLFFVSQTHSTIGISTTEP